MGKINKVYYGAAVDVDFATDDLEGEHEGDSRGSHDGLDDFGKRVGFIETFELSGLEVSDTDVELAVRSEHSL